MIQILLPVIFLPYLFRFALRSLGSHLRSRSQGRREAIIALARKDSKPITTSQTTPDDSDWEHVSSTSPPSGVKTPQSPSSTTPLATPLIIGFFHPFSNAGGGGERVLWAAIRATQQSIPNAICLVYTGDHDVDREMMVESVRNKFGLQIQKASLHFVYLTKRRWVLASTWPHFTLLGQSLGSIGLAFDALTLLVPDVFVDTMGYAFAVAVVRFLLPDVSTGAYVHYPTISTDMLSSLDDTTGQRGVNSGAGVGLKGMLKRPYWHIFAYFYGWVGRHIDIVMCNSSWTAAHIRSIWKIAPPGPAILYPPCPVEELISSIPITASPSNESTRSPTILYIAQFRPEKNHALILRSFATFLSSATTSNLSTQHPDIYPKLILLGSVRPGTADETHVYSLRLLARELHIPSGVVTFITDASFAQVRSHLASSSIGVNGMWNEHFGIGVVEYLAAGLIPVVHDSGGPKLDIVGALEAGSTAVEEYDDDDGENQAVGLLATTEADYAAAFTKLIYHTTDEERVAMRVKARRRAERFSEEKFARGWTARMSEMARLWEERTGRKEL